MNRSRARACTGKNTYTEDEAKAAATRRRAAGILVKAYHCPYAPHWHIGHLPLRVQLRILTAGKELKPRRRK